ncbi:MAG: sensor domain-containing diguanylate cyclase [Candidatus Anammoxibacter sp.]
MTKKVNLRRLVLKRDVSSIVNAFIDKIDVFDNIQSIDGKILVGKECDSASTKAAIRLNDEIIGWVNGGKNISFLALIVSQLAKNDVLNKALASEVLGSYDELILMQEISEEITTELNLEKVERFIIGKAKEIFKADNGSIMLMSDKTGQLGIVASFGIENREKVRMRTNEGIAGSIFVAGKAEIVNDVRSDIRFVNGSNKIHSMMCAPLKTNNNIIGVVNVSCEDPFDFTAGNLKMLTTLASQGAIAIENTGYTEELKKHRNHLEDMVKERSKDLNEALEELDSANKSLTRLSFIDGLTGVANRRRFDEVANLEWKRGLRDGRPLSIAMIDIDFFKPYNDAYGHQAGDDCLKKVANAFKNVLTRETDTIARYGGEEFVTVLPNTDISGANAVVEEMRAGIKSLGIAHTKSPVCEHVTVSIGVATMIPASNCELKTLIANADKALYEAKHNGRNQVCNGT